MPQKCAKNVEPHAFETPKGKYKLPIAFRRHGEEHKNAFKNAS
jgi:hypothetical protein